MSVTYNFGGLRTLLAEGRKLEKKHVQVGIFSDKSSRSDGLDNVALGLVHEKGSVSRNIPARSFLLMPLSLFFPRKLQQMGSGQFAEMLIDEGAETVAQVIGAEAEATVQEAFETGGFGFWKQWSRRYARANELKTRRRTKRMKFIGPLKPGSLLIQTAQLRRSVEARVVE